MLKKILPFFIVFLFNTNCFAQKQDLSKLSKEEKKEFEIANALFIDKQYTAACPHLKPILAAHTDDLNLKYMVGVCGIYVHNIHEEALSYLEEVKSKNPKTKNIDLYLALLLHKNYKFEKAIELATQLLSNSKIDADQKNALQQVILYSNNGKILLQNPIDARIQNLGSPPNSEAAEYSPVITSDEEKLIFTYRGKESTGGLVDAHLISDPKGDYTEDVFMSKKIDKVWQKPESIKSINTNDNDAAIAFSSDQKQLFLYKYTDAGKGDIYVSEYDGDKFSKPQALKGEVNTTNWEGSLSISVDGNKIFFSSDRPGGQGGKDLYVAFKQADGSWGKVKNLGDKINTKLDEDAPFIHPDGRTLVFSSEGHNTMGDFDIFSSDMNDLDSTWGAPVNLGYPINTTDDDLFYLLSADGKRGYFSTEKKGGSGEQDIYVVEPGIASKKTYLTVIKGKVTEDLFPVEAEISVFVSGTERKYTTLKSNIESGHYLVNLPSGYNYKIAFYSKNLGDKTFDIVAEKVDGYAEKTINVNFGMNDTSSTNHQTVVVKNTSLSGTLLLTDNINDKAGDTKVYLLNAEGKVIDSLRTDGKGFFNFKNLESDKKYLLAVEPDDARFKTKARYYLANEQGIISRISNPANSKKFIFRNLPLDPNALPDLYAEGELTLAGKFLAGDPAKALKNAKIKITNDHGDVVASTSTDQFGAFAFKGLPADQNYLISLDDADLALPANTKLILKNKNGKEIRTVSSTGGKFSFNFLASEKASIEDMNAGDAELDMTLYGYVLDENKKPLDNFKITLLDGNGEMSSNIKTDTKGRFALKSLKAIFDYILTLDENDARVKAIKKLFIADSRGRVYREVVRNTNGKFEFRLIAADKVVLGEFHVKDVPAVAATSSPKENSSSGSNGSSSTASSSSSKCKSCVEFATGSSELSSLAANKLEDLHKKLSASSSAIEIYGHADNTGSDEVNQTLSLARAQAVKTWLQNKSASVYPDSRFTTVKGNGSSEPISDNDSAQGRAKNRRAEVK